MAGVKLYTVYLVLRTYESTGEDDFTTPKVYEARMCATYGPGDGSG